jgi:hypothetical protein
MRDPAYIDELAEVAYSVMVPGHPWHNAGSLWRACATDVARAIVARLHEIKVRTAKESNGEHK